MSFDTKRYEVSQKSLLRDTRSIYRRMGDFFRDQSIAISIFVGFIFLAWYPPTTPWADVVVPFALIYFRWLQRQDKTLPFKMPATSGMKDKHNEGPGQSGKAEGMLFLGNEKKTGEELWLAPNDAKTHIMYLGTTGSGKTQGLMSIASNALMWGSGFVYIDGKADTDLWSSLSAMVRRFGRDDDLFVINYMTGNSDTKAPSNTMNPFSTGSASYLTQMLVSLLPDATGDNVMWKERAVSMVSAIMPALTWKRDHQDVPLSVSTIRNYMILNNIIKLSRDDQLPVELKNAIVGYLDTLPGFVHAAFDDNGQVKPPGPDTPNVDTTTSFTQHGYLSMQLTRALQSLGDDYGYIFDALAADVDMLDVVLNRRILIVLIPALEKSADETANLGKIVAATLKGMMGATLGATVEGESSTVIDNKPVHSSTPFMTIFDEVGYYTTQGMAVMAAQARSLGFSLVFAAQDLPALEKRVKEEARSIVANCNIKIFGKLEDPTQTKDLFDKTISSYFVTEVKSFNTQLDSLSKSYYDSASASIETRTHASYEELRGFSSGEAVICFAGTSAIAKMYYANPGHAKAMRVARLLPLPPPSEFMLKHVGDITKLRDLMCKKGWTAAQSDVISDTPIEINGAIAAFKKGRAFFGTVVDAAIMAVAGAYAAVNPVDLTVTIPTSTTTETGTVTNQDETNPVISSSSSQVVSAAPTISNQPSSPFTGFTKPNIASPQSGLDLQNTISLTPTIPDSVSKILKTATNEARDILELTDA